VSEQAKGAPILTVLLIGLLWGLNWPAVKFMLTEMPPLTIRAVALSFAAFVLAVLLKMKGQHLRLEPGDRLPMVMTGLLVVFGFNVFTALGQLLTETSKAAIIAFTMPAFTAVFAAIFLGERLGARGLIALAIGMAGLDVLASEDISALVAKPLGPVVMLLAALSWALGTVALKARAWSLPPLALTVWFFAVSSVACWPLVLVFEPPWHQSWPTAPVLWTLGYHTLGPMVVCYALWTTMVGRISATIAAIATLMVPIVGVASAVILLGDPMTWQKFLSLSMILTSIFMTQRPVKQAQCTN
jgi:drug/metabolite transporter (DMT)-like permease